MIPHAIHQVWNTAEVPSVYPPAYIRSWAGNHPDYAYRLWTFADLVGLAGRRFPDFLAVFRSDTAAVIKADFGRLMVLHDVGGVYADLDYACLRHLGPIIDVPGRELVASEMNTGNAYVHNALMASAPGHPLILDVLRKGLANWLTGERQPERVVGPDVFGPAVRRYVGPDLYLAPPAELCPCSWLTESEKLRETIRHESIADLRRRYSDAYAVTHWCHNW